MPVRKDLRNIAIVAHVDHGKTTLVDAMLWQSGAFREGADVEKRVMDSMDLEREKGITILAKNTAVKHTMSDGEEITLNIIDTPGHADFGGEVERGLEMVDGVLLLVDASEGPLPQTRFVLRKALAKKLPLVLVINKVDRPDARIDEVVEETYDLFMDLSDDDDASLLDVPVVYASAKAGRASLEKPADGQLPDSPDLQPLFDSILKNIPAPTYTEGATLQAHVTNLDASPYLGRLALCRIVEGELHKGEPVALCRRDGSVENVKLSEVLITEALDRVPTETAGPGDIVAVAGIPDITIGETITDPEDPKPLPLIHVDEPSMSMTIGINTSPLSGRSGDKLTARLLKARLDQELIGNVSIKVSDTDRPDMWEVQGRGELQLAVLVEMMRREGFELTVGKPQVVTREINGKLHEPFERVTVDCPEEFMGAVTQMMGLRKGQMMHMVNHGSGWVRMEFVVPARGLIGFRTEFLTQTRGQGIMNQIFENYQPWVGELRTRQTGSMVADRQGTVTSFALFNLQERGTMFVAPGDDVYEGMVCGENSRPDDMDVNPTKEKHLTNVRSSTGDELERLIPATKMSMEQQLEFCRSDECLEVTPDVVRIRKTELNAHDRAKARTRAKHA
ncbi:translational GTPase TypA [Acidipropionibacterium acidipropionici]|jgi:GTP-binding protein|uniref:Large ribosomal subunit assembly factor BipA n=2 Tax=Acidipropionibacterium acidipropionici TaxID=1748 RepID=A0AAC8YEU2_9ACTN|nr:translational GTPase TypA [Acidipropionibacterium acidipropionici]AFV90512.1 GTP-binding protein TypA [Acidipropionibacterium acidipropionici ATCC 4875]AMS05219.1 GTP-binding protein TypA [Acidipropionibacterium acidipropionici]AOZ46699.1 GTP-binding protein TypA [Acidipropionibacterium acidipropionici]AZP37231.1 translational GTPase TypA [Acidipropionibacterium acidipropionici]QCV94266.1 translational GTPase TypA [Acidipropionibacterium acidipropionici]